MAARLVIATAVAFVMALSMTACGGSAASGTELDAAAFAARVEQPDVVVLDVRTPEEFAGGHLPGARNVDVNDPSFEDAVGSLPKDGTYAIYCRSGNRSAQAMQIMTEEGFTDVAHLLGGIGAWQQAGGEVVTD